MTVAIAAVVVNIMATAVALSIAPLNQDDMLLVTAGMVVFTVVGALILDRRPGQPAVWLRSAP